MIKRRGNHEGSIHKREDGTWRVQLRLEGRRLSFTAKTRQDCQAWLKLTISQIDSGMTYQGANMKLGDYLELWLNTVRENRRPKTFIQYNSNIKRYILPIFGNTRLRDLQPIRIEKYLTNKQTEGVGDRTVQILYSILHAALASAVRKGMIGRNPMDAVDKPKVRNPKKIIVLETEEVQQLLIAAEGTPIAALIHLTIATGLREGEVLGLWWSDIDWQKSRLKVQRQVQRVPGQGLVFSSPKTDAGTRVIALGQATLDKLAEHQKQQEAQKVLAGEQWKEMGMVFTSSVGTPIDPRRLLSDFKALLSDAGLPPMRFHDLRHTSITLLLNEVGVPIKEVQRRAGHTRPSTTMDIYGGEATSKWDDVAAQSLDDLITPTKLEWHRNGTEEKSLPYK
jgi:integrase